jgi:hypothetical protein
MCTIWRKVALWKPLAKVDSIQNTTPHTPKAPNTLQNTVLALNDRKYEAFGSIQLDYNIFILSGHRNWQIALLTATKTENSSSSKRQTICYQHPGWNKAN